MRWWLQGLERSATPARPQGPAPKASTHSTKASFRLRASSRRRRPDTYAFFVEKENKIILKQSKPQPDTVPTTLTNFSSAPLKSAGGNILVAQVKNDTLSDSFSSL